MECAPHAAPGALDVGISQGASQRQGNGVCGTIPLPLYGDHYLQVLSVYSTGDDRIRYPTIYRGAYARCADRPPQSCQSKLGIWPAGLHLQQSENAYLASC